MPGPEDGVRAVLQQFQDGYSARDVTTLDAFMELFYPGDKTELIGIGAATRGGEEWFEGLEAIRSIVEGDWNYWGDVSLDVPGARITVWGEVAWLSTTGTVIQSSQHDQSMNFFAKRMGEILADESQDVDRKMMEATHYGLRRLRERHLGLGYAWPFVLTAILVSTETGWKFHTIHWSMPVD